MQEECSSQGKTACLSGKGRCDGSQWHRGCRLSRQDWGAGKSPNSSLMGPLTKRPQARISPPAPVPACHSRQKTCLVTWKTSFVRTSRENCCPSPTSSVQGCTLTLVFPNGLLDLFLMCIYKEFTVGKGLGLPQSAT